MATGDLSTTAAVREYLAGNVPVPLGDETLLSGLITAVSSQFKSETGTDVITASKSQTWSGAGGAKVFLEHYPVVSVTTVEVDGAAVSERAAIGEDGWVLSDAATGKLELVGYTFTCGVANCSVTYTAGLGATAPADIDQAVVDQVAYLYKMKDRVGITNESTQAGGSVTYQGGWQAQQGKAGQTPGFAAAVARYRRV
ncbi:MAG: hypothetical protein WCK73_12435, partial [Deltaproteobacteria bacterium]